MSRLTAGRDVAVQAVTTHKERDRRSIPILVSASTISSIGNAITSLAIPWFVLETTGSAAKTGIAGGLTVLATVISGMLGGAAVDRLGYKRTSVISDLLSGVTVALIPTLYFLDLLEFWHLLVLLFLGAVFDSPGWTARSAMVPALAKRARTSLERVNAAMEFSSQGSRQLVGPLAAGVLVALLGATGALYIDALTFVVSMALIGLLLNFSNARIADPDSESESVQSSSYFSDVVAGLRYVAADPFLRVIIPMSVLYNFLISPIAVVVLPVFSHDLFGSASSLGIILTGFGVGSIVGTVGYGARGDRVSPLLAFWWFAALIAVGFWLLWLSTSIWLAVLSMSLLGLAIGPTNVLAVTTIHRQVPEGMLGRVFGLLSALGSGAAPLGVFLAGFLIEATDFRLAMLAAAAGATIGLAWVLGSRGLRRTLQEMQEAESEAAEHAA